MLYGQQPAYEHLRMFGSLCYAHNQRRNGDKFASRSKKCVFIGYPYGKKGWKLFDLETKEIFVSRDVEFIETKYPFSIYVTTKEDIPPKNWNCRSKLHDESRLIQRVLMFLPSIFCFIRKECMKVQKA